MKIVTEKSLSGKVTRASKWLGFAQIFLSSLTFISITILARILAPEDYGLVAIASVVVALVQALAQIPVGQALIRLHTIEKAHFDTAFTISILRTSFLGILIAILAGTISEFYGRHEVQLILYVMSIATIISGFTNPKFILFEKDLDFKKHFISSSISSLVVFMTSVTIAVLTKSYWALVVGSVAGQFINVLITYFLIPYLPKLSLKKVNDVFSFAIWLSLSNLINQIQWNIDQIIIGKFLGASKLGLYNIGNRIAGLPSKELVTPLIRSFYPAFSTLNEDLSKLTNAFLLTQSTLMSMTLPLGLGLALFAEEAVKILVGDKWIESIIVVQFLAPCMAFQANNMIAKALAMSLNKTRWIFNRDVLMFCVHTPVIVIGFVTGGIFGVLIARIFTSIFITLISLFMVQFLLNISVLEQLLNMKRTLLSLIPMVTLSLILPNIDISDNNLLEHIGRILINVSLCGSSYILTHYIIWHYEGRPDGPEQRLMVVLKQLRKTIVFRKK